MQIQLLSAREFTERDSADSPAVAVVNEVFAQRYFAKQNPVGQHLSANVRGRRRELEAGHFISDPRKWSRFQSGRLIPAVWRPCNSRDLGGARISRARLSRRNTLKLKVL